MIPGIEQDEEFLRRRAVEERAKMKETSCMVRSVHEDMAELYEEKSREAEAETAALEDLARRIA